MCCCETKYADYVDLVWPVLLKFRRNVLILNNNDGFNELLLYQPISNSQQAKAAVGAHLTNHNLIVFGNH